MKFVHESFHMEGGFPGKCLAECIYRVGDDDWLEVEFQVKVVGKEKTPINLTNHTYWNLSGDFKEENIKNHYLQLNAPFYCPLDKNGIPTG